MTDTQAPPPEKKIIVVTSTKSVGVAIILTFIFGPLGMFYSTIWGAIMMLIIGIISIPFSLFTFGIPLSIVWIISIIWGALAADAYNKKLLKASGSHII